MPSRRDLQRVARAQAQLVQAALRELLAFMRALPSDPDKRAVELAEFFPQLIRAYGEAALAVIAEWMEDTAPRQVEVVLGEPVVLASLLSSLEWAQRNPEFTNQQVFDRLRGPLQRFVLQPGRDATRWTALENGVRWARVPSRPDPCAFCVILASRGGVYLTEQTATFAGESENKYHNDCSCVATPIWDESDYPEGYDPDALYDKYGDAASEVDGPADMKRIAAKMREMYGMR